MVLGARGYLCVPKLYKCAARKVCVEVANLGTTDVELRPQRKVAKVSHGREVTGIKENNRTPTDEASEEVGREYRNKLGVHVDESQVDAGHIEKLDKLSYKYRSVFTENEQRTGMCYWGGT